MRRRLSNRTRWLAAVAVAGAACWVAGFVWFVQITRQPAEPPPSHADGIVALTGGAGRVELALHLLATGQADKLLVSGIGGGSDLAALARPAGIDAAPLAGRITLGRYAASTWGNAVETAAWAAQNDIRSLIVVTAAYHMPRALAEMRQAMPNVHLFPLPVRQSPVAFAERRQTEPTPLERRPGLRLEAEEYTKYLLTVCGLSVWFPHREAMAAPHLPAGVMG